MSNPTYYIGFSDNKIFNGHNAIIRFSPDLKDFIIETFGVFLELEFLAAEIVTLDNGDIEYRFNCSKKKEIAIVEQLHKEKFCKGGISPSIN